MPDDTNVCVPLSTQIEKILGGGTPSRSVASYWKGDIPWASVKDFSDESISLAKTIEAISEAGLASSAANLIPPHTPIICTRMAVGRCGAADHAVAINQDLKALFPNEGVYWKYLLYLLKSLNPSLVTRSIGSTVKGVRIGDVKSLMIRKPPSVIQQRRIAQILDTLDETIRRTEQVIAKLQRMKQGLLHDLLTRGMDDNGELRDPEHHPEQFKGSPLGRIPKGWDVANLGDVYASPARNGIYKPSSYHGRGPLMVQMGGIFRGANVDFSGAGRVEVSRSELKTFGLQHGDLLFGRRSLVLEGAGKCALVDELPEPSTFESSIIRVRLDCSRFQPGFAALYLQSAAAYLQRREFIRQVAVSGVSGADIAQFPVFLPPVDEQERIQAAQTALNHRISEELQEVGKLQTIKHGLMEDLLTGRVRIPQAETAMEQTM